MKAMKTPVVILEDVFCRARYSECRLFCPRSIYSWWREVWLERVFDAAKFAGKTISPYQNALPALAHTAAPDGNHVPEPALAAALPLVTIAIPTFNREAFVANCVHSALSQTYPNIEVLVSDNASTDDTIATLASIDDPRLRVLTNPENVGAAGNFNKCVREARGQYLVLAADDNAFDPRFIEKCMRLVEKEPDLPIVLSGYDVLIMGEFSKDDRRRVPARLSKKLGTGIWRGTDILKEYLGGKISAQLLSSLIRTDIIRANGGYSAHPCAADEATWISILFEGKAGLVNECCATYMVHDASLSERFTADRRLADLCEVMEEISVAAEQKIADVSVRQQIQKLTARYVAYLAIINLLIYRRGGAGLADVARKLWSWRTMIGQCTVLDFATTLRLRSLGRILLPQSLARWSVGMKFDRLL